LTTEPYTFLIGADGTVQAKFEGAIDPIELREAIDALLGA
jgi:glutathione peroxidase-family protein